VIGKGVLADLLAEVEKAELGRKLQQEENRVTNFDGYTSVSFLLIELIDYSLF